MENKRVWKGETKAGRSLGEPSFYRTQMDQIYRWPFSQLANHFLLAPGGVNTLWPTHLCWGLRENMSPCEKSHVKIPSSADKTDTLLASMLISLAAAAIVENSQLLLPNVLLHLVRAAASCCCYSLTRPAAPPESRQTNSTCFLWLGRQDGRVIFQS